MTLMATQQTRRVRACSAAKRLGRSTSKRMRVAAIRKRGDPVSAASESLQIKCGEREPRRTLRHQVGHQVRRQRGERQADVVVPD